MDLANIIATNIQNLLDENNISVSEMSNILGVSRQTMTNYLKASTVVDSVQLAKMASYFNVPIADFFEDKISNARPEFIFRTALNYKSAIENVQGKIYTVLDEYIHLAKIANRQLCYFPEQYNLTLNLNNRETIDINFECQNYFDPKLRINNALRADIIKIANEQRSILKMGDKGAVNLISALNKRGINVIFLDFEDKETFGLSICEETKGCFIFINSNPAISVERQLFTLAHEYGHIIMHRPVYKRKLRQKVTSTTENLLDKMADIFAGYLLAPKSMFEPYEDMILDVRNNLNALYRFLISIKPKFQVSVQSLMMALKNLGYVPSYIVSDYFDIITASGVRKSEPYPLSENADFMNILKGEISNNITDMVHNAYLKKLITIEEAKNKLTILGNQTMDEIDSIINTWNMFEII